jgi:hypothetical protein
MFRNSLIPIIPPSLMLYFRYSSTFSIGAKDKLYGTGYDFNMRVSRQIVVYYAHSVQDSFGCVAHHEPRSLPRVHRFAANVTMNHLLKSSVKLTARGSSLLRGSPAVGGARLLNVHEYV